MTTSVLKCAIGVGLGGMLALGAATDIAQARTEPAAASEIAQYCVLPPDNPDAHRFYCEHTDGWSGHTGAARA
jgi:hypothetical protein